MSRVAHEQYRTIKASDLLLDVTDATPLPTRFVDQRGRVLTNFRWGTNLEKTRLNVKVVAYQRDASQQVCAPDQVLTLRHCEEQQP